MNQTDKNLPFIREMGNKDRVDEVVSVRIRDAQRENTAEKRKGSFDGDECYVYVYVYVCGGGGVWARARTHVHTV